MSARKPSYLDLENESSMLNWFTKIVDSGLPIPRTTILLMNQSEISTLRKCLDGEAPVSQDLFTRFYNVANNMGYPLFIRTDQASNKHDFKRSALVESQDELIDRIVNTIEYNDCAGMVGLNWSAIIFRKFLSLTSSFKAFGFMPVARERRYFVNEGRVVCHHPYWIEDAIRGFGDCKLPLDWKEKLADLNRETDPEIAELSRMAETFGRLVPGYWSVDFAHAESGMWYLIDAARAEISWHPDTCPMNPSAAKQTGGGQKESVDATQVISLLGGGTES